MSLIVQIADFETGWFTTPLQAKQELTLQDVINVVEDEYMAKLLGVELNNLFIADLDANGVPQTTRFVVIFEKFTIQEDATDIIYQSLGIKRILMSIVYYLYQRDQFTRVTDNGAKRTRSENSDAVRKVSHDIFSRWNQSVKWWEAIQYKCYVESPEIYPEFKGVKNEIVNRF